MRRLTLMRHGEAQPPEAGSSDFERALTRRGARAAQQMARRLAGLASAPQSILASSAARASETARIVAIELGIEASRLKFLESLYLAPEAELLRATRELGPRLEHVLLIAHNPGLAGLAEALLPDEMQPEEFAPAAFCTLEFECDWGALAPGCVRSARYAAPDGRLSGLLSTPAR